MKCEPLQTYQSLEEEVGAMWEEDGVQVKSLKYSKLGFEVIGVILIRI